MIVAAQGYAKAQTFKLKLVHKDVSANHQKRFVSFNRFSLLS